MVNRSATGNFIPDRNFDPEAAIASETFRALLEKNPNEWVNVNIDARNIVAPLVRRLLTKPDTGDFSGDVQSLFGSMSATKHPASFLESLPLLLSTCSHLVNDETEKASEALTKSDGQPDFYTSISAALVAGGQQDFRSAIEHYRAAAKIFETSGWYTGKHLINDFRGAFNTVTVGEIEAEMDAQPDVLPWTLIRVGRVDGAEMVNYSGVDTGYFERFCTNAATTFLSINNAPYHFHIAAVDEADLQRALDNAPAIANDPRIGLSYHFTGERKDNAYYTMVRYWYLKQVHDLYDLHLSVTDVDIAHTFPMGPLMAGWSDRGITVGLYEKRGISQIIPWFRYSCTLVVVLNNDLGKEFIRLFTKVAQVLYERLDGSIRYNIDQNILFSMVDFFGRFDGFKSEAATRLPQRGVKKTDFPALR